MNMSSSPRHGRLSMADVKKMKSEFRKSYKVNRNQFISNFRSYSKSIRRLFIAVGIIL